ncbi:hypothetical protein SNK04_014165 [Fusarium graminearum]
MAAILPSQSWVATALPLIGVSSFRHPRQPQSAGSRIVSVLLLQALQAAGAIALCGECLHRAHRLTQVLLDGLVVAPGFAKFGAGLLLADRGIARQQVRSKAEVFLEEEVHMLLRDACLVCAAEDALEQRSDLTSSTLTPSGIPSITYSSADFGTVPTAATSPARHSWRPASGRCLKVEVTAALRRAGTSQAASRYRRLIQQRRAPPGRLRRFVTTLATVVRDAGITLYSVR